VAAGGGSGPAGPIPMKLRNGRIAYSNPDGSFTDEHGRLIQ
jgi:hypothetical protein